MSGIDFRSGMAGFEYVVHIDKPNSDTNYNHRTKVVELGIGEF